MRGAREALDEAIAKVTQAEFDRLREGCDRAEVMVRQNRARKSLDLLWRRGKPDYEDEWVALYYVIRYQPRQVNLVHSVLLKSAPTTHAPVHVVDVGSGAWASMIALAIFHSAARRSSRKTEVTVHGIEPSEPMTRLGEELWMEFGCAAERMKLAPIVDTVYEMTDTITIFPSLDAYSSATQGWSLDPTGLPAQESWLLSVHAVYEETKDELRVFLEDYRERNPRCLRYELNTSDETKKGMVRSLVVPDSGEWLGPRREYWQWLGDPIDLPVWTGELPETTGMRRKVLDDFKVRWDSSNEVQDDAIWVRSVPR